MMRKRKSHAGGGSGGVQKQNRELSPSRVPISARVHSLERDPLDKPELEGVLELEDGSTYEGVSFGAPLSISGEIVFNTGMVGYPEALTDPSYKGQILVLTYPLVGNYGVPDMDEIDEFGLNKHFESGEIHISGLIVASQTRQPSHWNAALSLGQWLKRHQIPALYGIDTRAITKRIRECGTMLGKIEFNNDKLAFYDPNTTNLVSLVSTKTIKRYNEGGHPRIIAFDCGMKFNIIRYFIIEHKVEFVVVPYDYDLEANPASIEYDGIFLSNGPGDPQMAKPTIKSIQYALTGIQPPKPIFGICLGNQILALATGAKTFKMKYGNRGMNQPCIDLRTAKCYITPQNHGFAVDMASLDLIPDWRPFFINANDYTNEGIVHVSKPFFSVQFHPEAAGGPLDTAFLFDNFIQCVNGHPPKLTLLKPHQFMSETVTKVLLVGSGGLSIGQAGEFDYSGSQAIKALKEEGIEVILINPNIATVQTSSSLGAASPDKVYFLPITAATVLDIIDKEHPDGILISMGGQTALNVGIELWRSRSLQDRNVKVLGTSVDTIVATEDREIFSEKLKEIDETLALSYPATNLEEAYVAAHKIGYPVLVRAAFALGGLGSGFASDDAELKELAQKAFSCSNQILIDQDLRGWKEVEYEVVRDSDDNCITVCNMENFDPLGVHTGDSIVVAPSQTLSNREYFKLRQTALKVVRHLGVIGECNIQYALHPESEKYCIIEVNARLSRSSALASKATGYPLAYVATKLSLGIDLVSIRNSVTKITTACFEPSLDYCVVKVPRWDLKKFNRVSTSLGSSMKSVGEVMAIGRNFEEAIQKAVRMANPNNDGLEGIFDPAMGSLESQLSKPTDRRLYAVQKALEDGMGVDYVHNCTKIDKWFLDRLEHIANLRRALLGPIPPSPSSLNLGSGTAGAGASAGAGGRAKKMRKGATTGGGSIATSGTNGSSSSTVNSRPLSSLGYYEFRTLKQFGFSDSQIAKYTATTEQVVRRRRIQLGVVPVVKQIDTLAAEFPAQTNYLYVTYGGSENDVEPCCADTTAQQAQARAQAQQHQQGPKRRGRFASYDGGNSQGYPGGSGSTSTSGGGASAALASAAGGGVIVLGCGAYCIGSSVEFDWCAVSCLRQIRAMGYTAIVINYNPETVSTDYDESDRLYFEELSLERVLDIYEYERSIGVVVSVGGQIPNNLSTPLHLNGVNILGTSPVDIDRAEDRHKFSAMLDSIGVDQPKWRELTTITSAVEFANEVGYPVLVRPSFVLSGAAMNVAMDDRQLVKYLKNAIHLDSYNNDGRNDHSGQDEDGKGAAAGGGSRQGNEQGGGGGAGGSGPNKMVVVVTKFILNAKEIEFDAVAQDGHILNYAISEHVENAGVHSGDATLVLPAQKLYVETIRQVKLIATSIAQALNISGPFNIQLMAKENEVKVIECNLRASRTFPFVSKTLNHNFIKLATQVMLHRNARPYNISLLDIDYVGVKAPMFSFTRLRGADPTLGVEMASTGEVACFGHNVHEAFMAAIQSTGLKVPQPGDTILISIAEPEVQLEFASAFEQLHKMGFILVGTPGTAESYLRRFKEQIPIKPLDKPLRAIKAGKADNGKIPPMAKAAAASAATSAAAVAVAAAAKGAKGRKPAAAAAAAAAKGAAVKAPAKGRASRPRLGSTCSDAGGEDEEVAMDVATAPAAAAAAAAVAAAAPADDEEDEEDGSAVGVDEDDAGEDDDNLDGVIHWLKNRKIQLVINVPEGTKRMQEITSGYLIRRAAVDFGISLVTNVKCAVLLVEAMAKHQGIRCASIEEYYTK